MDPTPIPPTANGHGSATGELPTRKRQTRPADADGAPPLVLDAGSAQAVAEGHTELADRHYAAGNYILALQQRQQALGLYTHTECLDVVLFARLAAALAVAYAQFGKDVSAAGTLSNAEDKLEQDIPRSGDLAEARKILRDAAEAVNAALQATPHPLDEDPGESGEDQEEED